VQGELLNKLGGIMADIRIIVADSKLYEIYPDLKKLPTHVQESQLENYMKIMNEKDHVEAVMSNEGLKLHYEKDKKYTSEPEYDRFGFMKGDKRFHETMNHIREVTKVDPRVNVGISVKSSALETLGLSAARHNIGIKGTKNKPSPLDPFDSDKLVERRAEADRIHKERYEKERESRNNQRKFKKNEKRNQYNSKRHETTE